MRAFDFRSIVQCYPITSSLFSYLSPWDVAKLCHVLNIRLTGKQTDRFVNLIDDIFPDRDVLSICEEKGLQITLFGQGLKHRSMRLRKTHDYLNTYGEQNEILVPPVFFAISGNYGQANFPSSKYIYELEDLYRGPSPAEQRLSRYMRVEPLCSLERERTYWLGEPPLNAAVASALWMPQSSFWWNISQSEYPSSHRPSSSHRYGQVLAYISDGIMTEGRSIKVNSSDLPYIAMFSPTKTSLNYSTFCGQVRNANLGVWEVKGSISPLLESIPDDYFDTCKNEIVLSLDFRGFKSLDIVLGPGSSRYLAYW